MQEKQLLQDPGYVKGVKTTCCMLHGMLQGCMKYPMSKESKEIKNSHNTVISYVEGVESPFNRHYVTAVLLMSKESKVHLIYNVDCNSNYSN